MQKNDIVQVEIEDMGTGGEGIGKVDGYALFIKDAVIGDVVEAKVMKAKKNYGYARLMHIILPSKVRVAARCPQTGDVKLLMWRWIMGRSWSLKTVRCVII